MQTQMLLIRHGQTEWNRTGRWQGWAPVPLNDTGHAQAKSLANHLQMTYKISAIYSSDLTRAMQTAKTVARLHELPVIPDTRLRGPHIGAWQGLTWEEISMWDQEGLEKYMRDRHQTTYPGGESPHDVALRFIDLITEIHAAYADQTIVMVTHSGVLWAMVRYLGLELPASTHMHNTSITHLSYTSDEFELVSIAQVPHE